MQYHPSMGDVFLLTRAYGRCMCSVYVPINHDRDNQRIECTSIYCQLKTESTSDHLVKVVQVLQQLELVGFIAKLRKSYFMQKSVEYLGY